MGAGDRFCGAEAEAWPLLAMDEDGGAGGLGSGVLLLADPLAVVVPLLATLLLAAGGTAVAGAVLAEVLGALVLGEG